MRNPRKYNLKDYDLDFFLNMIEETWVGTEEEKKKAIKKLIYIWKPN